MAQDQLWAGHQEALAALALCDGGSGAVEAVDKLCCPAPRGLLPGSVCWCRGQAVGCTASPAMGAGAAGAAVAVAAGQGGEGQDWDMGTEQFVSLGWEQEGPGRCIPIKRDSSTVAEVMDGVFFLCFGCLSGWSCACLQFVLTIVFFRLLSGFYFPAQTELLLS